MVNPGISRDGKYPQNLKIGKYLVKILNFVVVFFFKNNV